MHARLLLHVEQDLAAPAGSGEARAAGAARDALALVGAAADPVTGRPVEAHLLAYDPDAFGGDGRVVVAAGDPATADDVALLVPGLGSDADSAAVHTRRALDLHLAARREDPGDGNAVVAWIGYDAPDGIGVLSERMARAGGALLADAVGDLRDGRAHDPAHLTVVGHSYGATTASLAATGPRGLDADDVVLAGSPGAADADSAADLRIRPGHVWVLRNSHDPVAALGSAGPLGLGEDPALDSLGRHPASSGVRRPRRAGAAGRRPTTRRTSLPGGEGLTNLARRRLRAPPTGPGTTAAGHDPWWAPPLDPELGRTPADPPGGRAAIRGRRRLRVLPGSDPRASLPSGQGVLSHLRPSSPGTTTSARHRAWRTASSAATWPWTSAPPTRWSTSAARACCSTSPASSRSTPPPARSSPSATRPSG